jgi:hypothetical protein
MQEERHHTYAEIVGERGRVPEKASEQGHIDSLSY